MIAARPAYVALLGIALSILPAWQASHGQTAPPSSVAPPARITTDTPEYCASLARRIERERRARPISAPSSPGSTLSGDVELLTAEGRRMCDQGLLVGGISRLRHAWMLLHPGE